jgi:hypothetical protein
LLLLQLLLLLLLLEQQLHSADGHRLSQRSSP